MDFFADRGFDVQVIVATVFYAVMGIFLMLICVIFFDKLFNLDLRKELVEEHNTAFGILFAGVAIAMAIIISSSIVS
jgi:uncharacterized membrane protein YjfL (UPF0719 family)